MQTSYARPASAVLGRAAVVHEAMRPATRTTGGEWWPSPLPGAMYRVSTPHRRQTMLRCRPPVAATTQLPPERQFHSSRSPAAPLFPLSHSDPRGHGGCVGRRANEGHGDARRRQYQRRREGTLCAGARAEPAAAVAVRTVSSLFSPMQVSGVLYIGRTLGLCARTATEV